MKNNYILILILGIISLAGLFVTKSYAGGGKCPYISNGGLRCIGFGMPNGYNPAGAIYKCSACGNTWVVTNRGNNGGGVSYDQSGGFALPPIE